MHAGVVCKGAPSSCDEHVSMADAFLQFFFFKTFFKMLFVLCMILQKWRLKSSMTNIGNNVR